MERSMKDDERTRQFEEKLRKIEYTRDEKLEMNPNGGHGQQADSSGLPGGDANVVGQ